MPDQIIIADPSRTVRTLVKLAFQDKADSVLEVSALEGLGDALGDGGAALLIVDEAWAADDTIRTRLADVASIVILGAETCRGISWAEALGVRAACVTATPKPVSRASVNEAAARVTGAGLFSPGAGDLKAMVAQELQRIVGEELKSVVWRVVPELAERLIKEELERLLKEDDEEEG